MQLSPAKQAAPLTSFLGKFGVDFLQKLEYLLICQMLLAPILSSPVFYTFKMESKSPHGQAPWGSKDGLGIWNRARNLRATIDFPGRTCSKLDQLPQISLRALMWAVTTYFGLKDWTREETEGLLEEMRTQSLFDAFLNHSPNHHARA